MIATNSRGENLIRRDCVLARFQRRRTGARETARSFYVCDALPRGRRQTREKSEISLTRVGERRRGAFA